LANDDFIFLRKDVSMEKIFNVIFLGALASLFVSRLFFAFSAKNILSNPFIFLLIPYFPGLSLLGGVVGAGIYIFALMRRDDQFPLGRLCDFFSIAFLISLPIGFLGQLLFSEGNIFLIKLGAQAVLYFVLFIIFLKFFLPRLLNGKFKEGTITFLFLICFSFVNLILNAFSKITILGYFRNFENIILILMFFSSFGILIWYENLLSKFSQSKKRK